MTLAVPPVKAVPRTAVASVRRVALDDPSDPVSVLDREPHCVEHRTHLCPHEDESDDRDHRDERQDQRVFGETLTVVVMLDERDDCKKL